MTRWRHRRTGGSTQQPDRGAALILAICFMVGIGGVCAGLAALVTSSLSNRAPLEATRNRQYSADGAVEYAIAQVRTSIVASPLTACESLQGSSTGVPVLNGIAIRVDWDSACEPVRTSDGAVVFQRNVIFSACLTSASPCRQTTAVIIRAQVNFEQSSAGPVTRTFIQTWSVNG